MNALQQLSRWIDTLNQWVGRGVAWVTLGLVLVVFVDVACMENEHWVLAEFDRHIA